MSPWVDGYQYRPNEKHWALFNEVGPGFFSTVGIPLMAGREFSDRDSVGTPPVAIVNAAFARKYFGDAGAIGRRLGETRDKSTRCEIVGVVAGSKVESPHDRASPMLFLAASQQPQPGRIVLHVRAAGTTPLEAEIRRQIHGLHPDLEIVRMQTADQAVAGTLQRERMLTILVLLFAGVAVFLTAVGLYGMMVYATTRRATEIGIRVALGATSGRVIVAMVGEAAAIVGAGLAVGLPLAAVGGRSLRAFLFGLEPLDLPTFAAAAVLLTTVALLAAFLPARAAACGQPLSALRHE
jgi:hypothetical protein